MTFKLSIGLIVIVICFAGNAVTQTSFVTNADSQDNLASRFNVLMRVASTTSVYQRPQKSSGRIARIFAGAIIKLASTNHRRGCKKGWMERQGGGFVCSSHLRKTTETLARPANRDRLDILNEQTFYLVGRGGARLYKNSKHAAVRKAMILLFKGSILVVSNNINKFGNNYVITRQKMLAQATNLKQLDAPVTMLGIDTNRGQIAVGAIVIDNDVQVFETPNSDQKPVTSLPKWKLIKINKDEFLIANNGWVKLPDIGYVKDSKIARVTPPPTPQDLKQDEKWISVDISEQLLIAWQGETMIRVIPCSTGIRGNTKKGKFRIQWKRRLQTLRLKKGHIRVEDVQWVMYYDQANSIAIHSAYWHSDFGKRKSHGCVNLPTNDAKFIYNFSAPYSLSEDSENFASRKQPGTRVIVF